MVRLVVLGAAAGGGFPQWNGNDAAARRARAGDPKARPRTQSSLAVSADGERWVLINASPDLRQQIEANPPLHPRRGTRDSPIAAVALTNGDVDHIAGLLSLRESQAFTLYAHSRVLGVLAANSIFNVLNPAFVPRRSLPMDEALMLMDGAGAPLGLSVRAFPVPGKVALWLEDGNARDFGTAEGDTLGLEIAGADGRSFFYIPACAAMTAELAARLQDASLVFFDGTLWRDDEMIAAGVGTKTGRRMGHMSCDGAGGSIAALADLNIARKIFIHINNTNPLFIAGSSERARARQAGWEIAEDGMEIAL
jgi:pyrroloquinoline quinone biosynthesis protein B